MTHRDTDSITGYHAHIYFDGASRETAWTLRETIGARFAAEVGRFHERPVGPHPCWSFQIAFATTLFPVIVPWLALNRGGLVVFIHPLTGDDLADHRDYALWLGAKLDLDLAALDG
ncbi:MAG: 4,5-dioxygenase [Acetobacteraceae bacterium]|nr:4,5-dioxygenase [Acetobacteraceae bacterium]